MGCSREHGTHYQCECMRERMTMLEEALRFYADEENYRLELMRHTDGNHSYKYVIQDVDKGERARAALPPSKEDAGE